MSRGKLAPAALAFGPLHSLLSHGWPWGDASEALAGGWRHARVYGALHGTKFPSFQMTTGAASCYSSRKHVEGRLIPAEGAPSLPALLSAHGRQGIVGSTLYRVSMIRGYRRHPLFSLEGRG